MLFTARCVTQAFFSEKKKKDKKPHTQLLDKNNV